MGRRYLTLSEAQSALNRGKSVECFLGACERDGQRGIKRLSVSCSGEVVCLAIYESADLGSEDESDLYEFPPLDPALYDGDADQEIVFETFQALVSEVETMFPGSTTRFVNQGVVESEYMDFLARGRK